MRRRILLVAPFAPAAAGRHGGARALHGLIGELARRHDVVLLHLDEGEVDPVLVERCAAVHVVRASNLGRWGVRARGAAALAGGVSLKAAASAVPQLRRRVSELTRTFAPGVVQVEFGYLGDALGGVRGPLRVVTLHDPAATLGESLALRDDGLPFVHHADARVALREERRVLARADAAVVFSERDREVVARTAPAGAELVTIPLGWDVPAAASDPAGHDPPTLLFVGNFVHPPNVDAALTLATRILPLVRAEHPDIRLEVVGANPPPVLRALASDHIDVTGEVESVAPYLDRAALVVVPIALGGGMRVKLLEALGAGKAVVASTLAAEGIATVSGTQLVVTDGDALTAAAVSRLLASGAARRRLGESARTWAVRELSWATMADRYDELYARHERRA